MPPQSTVSQTFQPVRLIPGTDSISDSRVCHIIRNDGVRCSNHLSGTILFKHLAASNENIVRTRKTRKTFKASYASYEGHSRWVDSVEVGSIECETNCERVRTLSVTGEQKLPDARKMLLHAEEFRRAGIMLEPSAGQPPDQHTQIPMFVCFSFALEIYLKFLIVHFNEKIPARTHDVEKLFKILPIDLQQKIRNEWINAPVYDLKMRKKIASITGRDYPDFDDALHESSLKFELLRYCYVNDAHGESYIGGDIMTAVRRLIFKMFPTEFASSRLPLPAGVPNYDQQSGMTIQTQRIWSAP